MQPDYNQLWRNLNHDDPASESHFYAFFEDSLNQFISTNSSSQPAANKSADQVIYSLNNDVQASNGIIK